jgi:hypothetical protein
LSWIGDTGIPRMMATTFETSNSTNGFLGFQAKSMVDVTTVARLSLPVLLRYKVQQYLQETYLFFTHDETKKNPAKSTEFSTSIHDSSTPGSLSPGLTLFWWIYGICGYFAVVSSCTGSHGSHLLLGASITDSQTLGMTNLQLQTILYIYKIVGCESHSIKLYHIIKQKKCCSNK